MSYVKFLDEFYEEELNAELSRRQQLRRQKLCDYCARDPETTNPCKFPERHKVVHSILGNFVLSPTEKLKSGINVEVVLKG